METALNAVWDAGPGPSDRVAVVGAGVVGSTDGLAVAELIVGRCDSRRHRSGARERRIAFGLGFASTGAGSVECELSFTPAASSAGLATALTGRRRGDDSRAQLVWQCGVPVPLGGAFHSRRLKLVASQVGMVAPSHRREWTYRHRLEQALSLLADDRLDVLLEHPVAFADLPAAAAAPPRSRTAASCANVSTIPEEERPCTLSRSAITS